jgi:hypothetical protein
VSVTASTFKNFLMQGDLIIIFMAVIYYLIVVPYRAYMRKRGQVVFGDPPPTVGYGAWTS